MSAHTERSQVTADRNAGVKSAQPRRAGVRPRFVAAENRCEYVTHVPDHYRDGEDRAFAVAPRALRHPFKEG
jgi:hypothetical protein